MSRWRVASASVIGASHLQHKTPCQDYSLCSVNADRAVCAISDGAGSASHADTGARITARHFVQTFGNVDPASINREQVTGFHDALQEVIGSEARANGATLADYACTLLGVIASPTHIACVQIGDGAIVVLENESRTYDWVFWPQHGEYTNTTNFVTQADARDVFELRIKPAATEFAMFSDGLERLILNFSTHRVHAPALQPIADWLRTAEADDADERLRAITTYLESDHINQRTDDDKSLAIAVLAQD